MRQKIWLALLPAYLSGILTVFLISCASGPKIAVYISNPAAGGMDYYDIRSGKGGFVGYDKTDKFVCHTPADDQILLNQCAQK